MHKHFIHAQSYITRHTASDVFLSEIGMQNEEGFLQPTKASERP